MAEIVKIIAPTAFDYSHDNGVTLLRYEPGQIYEVPAQSIEGLRRRKAIEILDRQAVDDQLSQAVVVDGAETDKPLTGEGSEAGDADDGKDDGDDKGDADDGKDDGDDKGAADKGKDTGKAADDVAKTDSSKPSKPSTPAKAK